MKANGRSIRPGDRSPFSSETRLDIRLAENPIDLGAACGQIPVELGEIDAGLLRCEPHSGDVPGRSGHRIDELRYGSSSFRHC
jgi:hypothetical protein